MTFVPLQADLPPKPTRPLFSLALFNLVKLKLMKLLVVFACIIWFTMAAAGVVLLARYKATPEPAVSSYPLTVPIQSALPIPPGLPTLIFFAHPKCPCTRASLRELARLMSETGGKLNAFVVIIEPADVPSDWTETDLRRSAEAIPGVTTIIDRGEKESLIFNAKTSGTTLLYNSDGHLEFGGGITAARGHEGDNLGRRTIFNTVITGESADPGTPVFGCPLRAKDCSGEMMPIAN